MSKVAELPHEKFMRSKGVELPAELQEIDTKLKEAKKVDYESAKEVSLEIVEILKNKLYSLHVEMEAVKETLADHEERIEALENKVQEQENAEAVNALVDNAQTQDQDVAELLQENAEQIMPSQVQETPQETENNPENELYTGEQEKILADLYHSGVMYISPLELKEMGFYKGKNIKRPGFWGKKYGRYALKKRFSDKIYTIEKLY
jgi:hypothetical protein